MTKVFVVTQTNEEMVLFINDKCVVRNSDEHEYLFGFPLMYALEEVDWKSVRMSRQERQATKDEKRQEMRVVDCLKKYQADEIKKCILELYPGQEGNNWYRSAIRELLSLEPVETDDKLFVTMKDYGEFRLPEVVRLSEGKPDSDIKLSNWNEVLSMCIVTEYPWLDTIAHILYDLTYYGNTQS